MTSLKKVISVFIIIVFLTGCSHQLKVKNVDLYRPDYVSTQVQDISVGFAFDQMRGHEERLLASAANAMKRDGFQVTIPYYPVKGKSQVDYAIEITPSSEFKGSGWNFLINWPGFLIWTPAWHGYNYYVSFNYDMTIEDASKEGEVTKLEVPINLVLRHAAMNRTWTEISWLEWSVIAFIGGIVFTKYDPSVTPILLDAYEDQLGDFLASKVATTILALKNGESIPSASIAEEKTKVGK